MTDERKTKQQLISELAKLRQRVAQFEASEVERGQVGEALRESEEKYRNLVEQAQDGVCIIQDGMIKYANSLQAELWGGAVEEIVDTPFTNYVHPDDLPWVVERYKQRMAGEQVPSIYEVALLRKDGSKAYVELNVGLIDYLGKPAEFVITRDITERRQAEDRYRLLIEDMNDGYVVVQNGEFAFVNRRFGEMLGYEPEQLLGKTITELLIPGDRQAAAEQHQRVVNGKVSLVERYEAMAIKKDGTKIICEANVKPIEYEGKPGVSAVIR
ncbi:PAS domain-containing protein, partial [Chloroflexota bacterium]